MTLENLDKSLADTVSKINEATPGAVEKIIAAYAETNVVSSAIGLWCWPISIAFFLIVAIIALVKDDGYDTASGGFIGFLCAIFAFGCFIGFAHDLSVSKAPQAYAVKELTEKALEKAKD